MIRKPGCSKSKLYPIDVEDCIEIGENTFQLYFLSEKIKHLFQHRITLGEMLYSEAIVYILINAINFLLKIPLTNATQMFRNMLKMVRLNVNFFFYFDYK